MGPFRFPVIIFSKTLYTQLLNFQTQYSFFFFWQVFLYNNLDFNAKYEAKNRKKVLKNTPSNYKSIFISVFFFFYFAFSKETCIEKIICLNKFRFVRFYCKWNVSGDIWLSFQFNSFCLKVGNKQKKAKGKS